MAVKQPEPSCDDAVQSRLWIHAQTACLPYLLGLPELQPIAHRLSLLVVGSVATGLCDSESDTDIAVLCSRPTYAALRSTAPREWFVKWESGRPLSARVDERPLHWYVTPLPNVRRALLCHNDGAMYQYGTGRVLRDPRQQLRRVMAEYGPEVQSVRRNRGEGKLDMLIRRGRALELARSDGPLMYAKVLLEILTLALKTVALLDGVPFDPRKHLEATALTGELGRRLRPTFLKALSGLGLLGNQRELRSAAVLEALGRPVHQITAEAVRRAQELGLSVGLPRPDPRHAEPQPRVPELWQRRCEWLQTTGSDIG